MESRCSFFIFRAKSKCQTSTEKERGQELWTPSQSAKRERIEQAFNFYFVVCLLFFAFLLCLLVMLVVLFVCDVRAGFTFFSSFLFSLLFLVPSFINHFHNTNMHKNWRERPCLFSFSLSLSPSLFFGVCRCMRIHSFIRSKKMISHQRGYPSFLSTYTYM